MDLLGRVNTKALEGLVSSDESILKNPATKDSTMRHSLRSAGTALFLFCTAVSSGLRAGTQDDSCLEPWTLVSFQPNSESHGKAISSEVYHNRPTVILLLASW